MTGTMKRAALCAAVVAIAGCSASAGPGATEAIAADGGDLGQAWLALHAAMKAGDAAKATPLLDGRQWNLANKQPSWFQMFAEGDPGRPMGGRRNGDRATLFLDESTPGDETGRDYRHVNATRVGSGWVFDNPTTLGSSFSTHEARDCVALPTVFPCGVETAPAGKVAGTIVPKPKPDEPERHVLLDGFAARMVPSEGGEPTATRVVLSTLGINPAALALSSDPDHVYGWLGWPVMKLDIAPDGSSATLEYYGGRGRAKQALTKELVLEPATPGRIKGRLALDHAEAGKIDVSFDLSTASICRADEYPC